MGRYSYWACEASGPGALLKLLCSGPGVYKVGALWPTQQSFILGWSASRSSCVQQVRCMGFQELTPRAPSGQCAVCWRHLGYPLNNDVSSLASTSSFCFMSSFFFSFFITFSFLTFSFIFSPSSFCSSPSSSSSEHRLNKHLLRSLVGIYLVLYPHWSKRVGRYQKSTIMTPQEKQGT